MHASVAASVSRRAATFGAAAVLAAGLAGAHAADTNETYNRLLDRYLVAVNAHDTRPFPEIFTEAYIQHSGRSPSGLQAQIGNFQRIFENWPDFQSRFEDRIFGGDRIVVRTTFSGTHAKPVLGFAPTGKRVTWGAIDIWRVENGKLAEHWDMVDVAGLQKQLRGD
jgi:predicted ester cyclase